MKKTDGRKVESNEHQIFWQFDEFGKVEFVSKKRMKRNFLLWLFGEWKKVKLII